MPRHVTQKILAALPGDGSGTTAGALAAETGIDRNQVYDCCEKLRRRSLLEKVRPGCYRLTVAGLAAQRAGVAISSGPNGPNSLARPRIVAGTLRQRLWKALRNQTKSTIPELVQLAARGDEKAAENNAGKYLGYLQRTGFVKTMARREPGTAPSSNGYLRYLLLPQRNTGPKAPVVRERQGLLYDPNTGKTYSVESGEEVKP